MTEIAAHPAEFSVNVLVAIRRLLAEHATEDAMILDPFAGRGSGVNDWLAAGYDAVGIELEPEWAAACPPHVHVGSVLAIDDVWPDVPAPTFGAIVTSPCYGNRMADHHDARDDSRRITYTHSLGRHPSPDSAAVLQWGKPYRDFHLAALRSMIAAVVEDALLVINMSNHVRGGVEQLVTEWWLNAMLVAGCRLVDVVRVPTPRMGFGANGDARAECEFLLAVRTPPTRRLL